jgi:hypothetical protein
MINSIVQLTNQSGAAQTNVTFSVAPFLPRGLLATTPSYTLSVAGTTIPSTIKPVSFYADGSVKSIFVSGVIPSLSVGQSVSVDLATSTAAPASPLGQSQILATAFDANIAFTASGYSQVTGSVRNQISQGHYTVIATGTAGTVIRVFDPTGATDLAPTVPAIKSLQLETFVHFWPHGPIDVQGSVQNSNFTQLQRLPTNTCTITLGTTPVVVHDQQTNFNATVGGWLPFDGRIGTAQTSQIDIQVKRQLLIESGFSVPVSLTGKTDPDIIVNGFIGEFAGNSTMPATYKFGDAWSFNKNWTNGGYSAGLFEWRFGTNAFLGGDHRALSALSRALKQILVMPMFFRERNGTAGDNLPITAEFRPTVNLVSGINLNYFWLHDVSRITTPADRPGHYNTDGTLLFGPASTANGPGVSATLDGDAWYVDNAHAHNFYSWSWVLQGDWRAREAMRFYAARCLLNSPHGDRGASNTEPVTTGNAGFGGVRMLANGNERILEATAVGNDSFTDYLKRCQQRFANYMRGILQLPGSGVDYNAGVADFSSWWDATGNHAVDNNNQRHPWGHWSGSTFLEYWGTGIPWHTIDMNPVAPYGYTNGFVGPQTPRDKKRTAVGVFQEVYAQRFMRKMQYLSDIPVLDIRQDHARFFVGHFSDTSGSDSVIVTDGITERKAVRQSIFGMYFYPITNGLSAQWNTSRKVQLEVLTATYRNTPGSAGASYSFPQSTPVSWHADIAVQMGAISANGSGLPSLYNVPAPGSFAFGNGTGSLAYLAGRICYDMPGGVAIQPFLDEYKPFKRDANNHSEVRNGLIRTTQVHVELQCSPPVLNTAGTTIFDSVAGVANSFASQSLPSVITSAAAGTWSKLSGPSWVSIAANGSVSITSAAVAGLHTVLREFEDGCAPNLQQNIVVNIFALDPIITVNGTSSSSPVSPTSEVVANAFDANDNTKFLTTTPSLVSPASVSNPGGVVITYQNSAGVSNYATSYAITSANDAPTRDPKNFRLQGFDGTNWVTLDTRTNESWPTRKLQRRFFVTGNTNPVFNQYRLLIDQNNGSKETLFSSQGLLQIADFEVRGLSVASCTPPTLTTAGTTSFSGVSGTANSFASQVLPVASPASPATTWTKLSGDSWITIGSNGAASISAAAPVGTFTAVREGSNGCAPNVQQTLTFTIAAAPCVAPVLTTVGTLSFSGTAGIGNAFSSQVLPVVSSTPAGSWVKTSGPAWVNVAANGAVSTTSAATAGSSSAVMTYSNGCAPDLTKNLTFSMANAAIAPDVTGPLPTATEGQAYSATLTTVGSPTSITVTPSWLSVAYVSGNWVLSGTPPAGSAGTLNVSFSLTNPSSTIPVSKTLPLTVAAAPVVGAIGAMGPYTVEAGVTASYTIPQTNVTGIAAVGAPSWVSIAGNQIVFQPPVGTAGLFSFTVQGTSNGNPVTQNISIRIGPRESVLFRARRGLRSLIIRFFRIA